MHVAKSTLSQLVKKATAGETVYIGAYGRATVKLVPVASPQPNRKRFGLLEGLLTLPDDLDSPLPDEIIRSFEGDE